jgi:CRISPR/Cas system CSM-associated protein Csm2 small subunit
MEEINVINTRIERLKRKISELQILQEEEEREGNIQKALDILERICFKNNQVRRLLARQRAKIINMIESRRSTVSEQEFEDIVASIEAMVGHSVGLRPSEP